MTIFFGDLPNVQRERILILQPPTGENYDYDSEKILDLRCTPQS